MKKLSLIIAFFLPTLTIAQKQIPGIIAVDVYGNFINIGFNLERKFDATFGNLWICRQESGSQAYIVETFGKSTAFIQSVRGSTEGGVTSESIQFLAYLATTSYDGSNPERAKQWVIDNINKGGSLDIGRVRFTIRTPSKFVRTLLLEGI